MNMYKEHEHGLRQINMYKELDLTQNNIDMNDYWGTVMFDNWIII